MIQLINYIIGLLLITIPLNSQGDIPLLANIKSQNNSLTLPWSEIKKIFEGKKTRWSNGHRITVILLKKDDAIQERFIRRVLGYSPYKFFRLVENNSNGVFYDEFVDRDNIVLYLNEIPGSIGIVDRYFLYYNSGNYNLTRVKIRFDQ